MTHTPAYELVVTLPAWRSGVMPLLTDAGRVATGLAARDRRGPATGLLLHELADRPRTGDDFGPQADWVAVAAPGGDPPDTPDAWLARLQPRFGQTLALVLIGFGPSRGVWRGWVAERGTATRLATLRIVGPGQVRVGGESSEDDDRWPRLRGAVGDAVFAKLRAASVAVVGCSRTGSLAAAEFAALGVRRLALVDGDALEPHNLDANLFAMAADVGQNKAVALGRRLVASRPELAVTAWPRPLDRHVADRCLAASDLVATCVDRDAARLTAARWSRRHLVPHLDVGTGVTRTADGGRQLAADVRLLLPGSGCVACVGGLGDRDQAEYEYHAPPGALPRRPPEPWDARGRLGSLATLNGLAVSAGVQSWLDLLAGRLTGSIWHRWQWQPGEGLEARAARVDAGRGCEVCSGK